MILGDPRSLAVTTTIGGRATLDELLQWAAQRRPDSVALIDPPNRQSFTGGEPRQLTYAQADRMVSAIAARLRLLGLQTDGIVGLQMANTVESVLTLLGVLRAGLIAMPLPLLWRQAEATAALRRVGASALIVIGRVGTTDHYDLAMQIAREIFPVRYVCGFGGGAPDGVVCLDELYEAAAIDALPSPETERATEHGPGAHLAVITWDQTAAGLVPVARSHAELIAGGLAVLIESRLDQDAVILSTLMASSFGGLSVSVMPWLLLGGTLALHQPFDPTAFLAQIKAINCDTVVVPGPLTQALADAGHFTAHDRLASVISVWRSPERLTHAPVWHKASVRMIDVQVFGEIGLIAARREPSGVPTDLSFGPVFAPHDPKGAVEVAEIMRTEAATVALRGSMVPLNAFPPGAERSELPHFKVAANGFVDTGYACRPEGSTMVVTGAPPGIVSIGGYRFAANELQDFIGCPESGKGTLAILPDALIGHRLAASAADRDAACAALASAGANPLITGAFREQPRRSS